MCECVCVCARHGLRIDVQKTIYWIYVLFTMWILQLGCGGQACRHVLLPTEPSHGQRIPDLLKMFKLFHLIPRFTQIHDKKKKKKGKASADLQAT